jgi:hypothetical protein
MRTKIKWLVAIAAFAVLATACGTAEDSAAPETTTPPITVAAPTTTAAVIEETTTTTEVAETTTTTEVAVMSDAQAATIAAYETAWNDGEWEAFRALFAPSASLDDSMFGVLADVDRIVAWSAARLAMGVEFSIDDCVPSGEGVRCEAEFDGPIPIAMNTVPWRDRYAFSFEDGKITNINVTCIICWDGGADDRLSAWVKTVDETAWKAKYYGYNGVSTAEAAAFWLEWAPKWQEAGRP